MKKITGFECPQCEDVHESMDAAMRCCRPVRVAYWECSLCGKKFNSEKRCLRHEENDCEIENCAMCRHRDANDGRRFFPCPDLSGAPVHAACEKYTYATR